MREGTFLGQHVVLSEKDWKNCLNRVDVSRAKKEQGKYVIHIKCPFCKSEDRDCEKCPLDVYRSKGSVATADWGCVHLFKLVATELGIKEYPALYDDYVSWFTDEPDNRESRRVLSFIRDGLLKMRRK